MVQYWARVLSKRALKRRERKEDRVRNRVKMKGAEAQGEEDSMEQEWRARVRMKCAEARDPSSPRVLGTHSGWQGVLLVEGKKKKMNHRIHLYFFLFSRTPKHRFWKLKTFFNSLNFKNEELSHLPLWRGNEGEDSWKENTILKTQNWRSKQGRASENWIGDP